MNLFVKLFKERAERILALSKLSQIALEGLSQMSKDTVGSKFTGLFRAVAVHLPDLHQNNTNIPIPEYKVVAFLDGLTLISLISEVEAYFQDLVTLVLKEYPEKIGNSQIELRSLLELSSLEQAKEMAAQRFASNMMFKKPNEYKKDLLSILSADEHLLKDLWPTFVEAKARRDIGIHNGWIVNDLYRAKVSEVGIKPTAETALPVNHPYLDPVRKCCLDIMEKLTKHCAEKFTKIGK